jgi:hypothetical protein
MGMQGSRRVIAYGMTVALIAAAYPLGLSAHLLLDAALGDGLLMREWRYGSQRAVAAEVVNAWSASLLWVLLAWLGLALLRRTLGAYYAAIAGAAGLAALVAAIGGVAPIPTIFAWLFLACVALEAAGHELAARRIAAWL